MAAFSFVILCGSLAAPWSHEHGHAPPHHDHGNGAVHAHWEIGSNQASFSAVLAADELQYSATVPGSIVTSTGLTEASLSARDITRPRAVSFGLTQGSTARAHGPPGVRCDSLRSPPA